MTTAIYENQLLRSTWKGIQYGILDGGNVREHYENDATRASLPVVCRWYERITFVQAVLGGAAVIKTGGSDHLKYISREIPMHHPEFPSDDVSRKGLLAVRVSNLEPFVPHPDNLPRKKATQPNWPDGHVFARMDLEFETLPYDVRPDGDPQILTNGLPDESLLKRYVSFDYRPAAETLALQGAAFYLVGTNPGVPFPRNIVKILPKFDLAITWHQVPVPAIGTRFLNPNATQFNIDDALGKVNSVAWMGYSVGQLLLVGVAMKPYRNPFGLRIYDVTFMISILPSNHQKLYFANSSGSPTRGFYEIVTENGTPVASNLVAQADDKNIYNYDDLRDIFKPS